MARKERIVGPPSSSKPPQNCPVWALNSSYQASGATENDFTNM